MDLVKRIKVALDSGSKEGWCDGSAVDLSVQSFLMAPTKLFMISSLIAGEY
jgi:hypothetical protein